MKRGVILALVFAAIILFALLRPLTVVTVRLPREGGLLLARVPVRAGDEVKLQYDHSVERTEVLGIFGVGEGPALYALETRMRSVGTGLPNAVPERTRREGGWLVVDERGRAVEELRFFFHPDNDLKVIVAGVPVPLSGLRSGAIVEIRAVRLPVFQLWSLKPVHSG